MKRLLDYHLGQEFDLVVLIKYSQLRKSKNNQSYLVLQFSDSSGELRGNLWQAEQQDAERFKSGVLVELNGKLEEYQGKPQVRIYDLRVVDETEGYQLDDFIKGAPEGIQEMKTEINEYVLKILNPTWNRIVRGLLSKWDEQFFDFPAGKSNHHAVRGGLAFHTLSMLRVAKAICDVYPQVDRSLLYAGCILHDMGKVLELSGPAATKYTNEGNLIGHLVLIDEQIMLMAEQLSIDSESEDLLLLRHLVISHHGKPEYGAAKIPALLEAELLHRIDDLDATVYAITNALQHTVPGEFTQPILAQDGRRFYRPKGNTTLADSPQLE